MKVIAHYDVILEAEIPDDKIAEAMKIEDEYKKGCIFTDLINTYNPAEKELLDNLPEVGLIGVYNSTVPNGDGTYSLRNPNFDEILYEWE